MSSAAKLAIWISVNVICIWASGMALRCATFRWDFTEPKAEESLAFAGKRFDVLYFGNSLVLEGVDPVAIDATLSTTSYNFALGGASILESEMQLRHFLAHNDKPALVALGLYVNQRAGPSTLRPTVYFALSPELRAQGRAKLRFENQDVNKSFVLFNSVPAYRYRNTLELVAKAAISRVDQRPAFAAGQARVTFSRQPVDLGAIHDGSIDLAELRSFMDLCAEHRIALLLFEPPNHLGFNELTRNRATVLREIEALVRAQPGTAFTSFNPGKDFPYEAGDWVNLNHLNVKGSAKLAKLLAVEVRDRLPASVTGR